MLFLILPLLSFIIGFFWMWNRLDYASSNMQHSHLRHDEAAAAVGGYTHDRVEKHHREKRHKQSHDREKSVHAIGMTVWKTFIEEDGSKKSYLGEITSHDDSTGLYTVVYEDGCVL
jgi:ABC-type nickel/cobalt efflux system permease component RcnA